MPLSLLFRFVLLLFLFAACRQKGPSQDPGPTDLVTGDPVETLPPNTDYLPAFEGQTRIGSIETTTPMAFEVITSQLSRPWDICTLPDGRLLVTLKNGTMHIVTTSGAVSTEITGLPLVNTSSQGGLLGVCLDSDFTDNRTLYFVYSLDTNGHTLTAVAKGQLSSDEQSIQNVNTIYRALPSAASTLHYGGRILMDATGHLMVTTGERSILATRPEAQKLNSALGKIIRITTSGAPAADNPSYGASALPELYSIGHRNPQGIAIHPVTGEVWISDFGPRGGDEINLITPGKNYGWPIITYGIEYGGAPVGAGITQQAGMEQPRYYWDPSISPSGICFYTGTRIPEWENNLLVCALSGQHIARLHIQGDRILGEERLLESEGQRFRAMTQGADGALYAITDAGRLYRIDRK